jgi:hypothetical protein
MSCLVSRVTASVLVGRNSALARLCVTGKTTQALNALYDITLEGMYQHLTNSCWSISRR